MSSSTWQKRRVDSILLTTDYKNKQKKTKKSQRCYPHHATKKKYCYPGIDFVVYPSEIMQICRLSNFGQNGGHAARLG